MNVLVMQLAGPMQSWGSSARFARRTSEAAPTKSGVVGLLAAAFGRDRREDVSDLASLRFGVRVDQRGILLRDYQTAHHFVTGGSMPVSERFYLHDAVFLAAVEGDDDLVDRAHRALHRPGFLPYLGRRSCPPARPVDLGLRTGTGLDEVLRGEPWHAAAWYQRRVRNEPQVDLEVLVDNQTGVPDESLRDQPISFDPRHRRYALRGVHAYRVTVPNPAAVDRPGAPSDHDPMSVLEEA